MHPVHVHKVPPMDSALEVEVPRLPEAMQDWNLGSHCPCFAERLTHLGRARKDVGRDEPIAEEDVAEDLV